MDEIEVGAYQRYSNELQNAASIEDQRNACIDRAKREGWKVVEHYSDAAISGFTMSQRPGIQKLMADMKKGKFKIVLAEGLDRISRDQEDTSKFYKLARFHNVKIITLQEGEISSLHVGFKGTMNAVFFDDMKIKVKRGQKGRVEAGKAGGGNCYGYRVVRKILAEIFRQYADGMSPRRIATGLNRDGIPGRRGRKKGEKEWREIEVTQDADAS
ncbi:recombinase family protein [Bradyrhizobium yuanmingense]|uniref:recombinase family protein n=1 Tax=Bradyrhizobium yuanmingense TaxID=108015 RepID=UPI0023B8C749|nr:recombinase family protein [Bradyrhizobium yuanmingense]MDF0584742.1 recombinase family protein [Bradyrhizobium yuanmingense]